MIKAFFHRHLRRLFIGLICWALPLPGYTAEESTAARVVVAVVTEQEVGETVAAVGALGFDRVASVAPEVSGLIQIQNVREGDLVDEGQVLVELNTDFVRQDIAIRRKEQEEIQAELMKSEKSLNRLGALLQTNAASREAYDVALYDHQVFTKRRERLVESIRRLELELEKSRLRAPFPGLILQKFRERGDWVGPQVPVLEIASTKDVVAIVAVSESVVRFQHPGTQVPVRIDAADLDLTGTVLRLDPVADLRSKSINMKIAIPYRPPMRKNMSANALIPVTETRRLRLIDRDALVSIGGKDFVYTVENARAKRVPINVLTRLGGKVAVDDPGVRPGMQVVVDGNDRLRPDQPLAIVGTR